jgi:hypothetical protein
MTIIRAHRLMLADPTNPIGPRYPARSANLVNFIYVHE